MFWALNNDTLLSRYYHVTVAHVQSYVFTLISHFRPNMLVSKLMKARIFFSFLLPARSFQATTCCLIGEM